MKDLLPEINGNKIQHHRSGEKYCTCIAQTDWEKDLTPKPTDDKMQQSWPMRNTVHLLCKLTEWTI